MSIQSTSREFFSSVQMSSIRLNRHALPNADSITVKEAQDVVALWKQHFPNVTIITSPELGQPYLTLAHGFPGIDHMDVNGLQMKNPLFTMALASFEVAKSVNGSRHYAHAYEAMWPNISSPSRESSNMGNYVNNLWKLGMEVHADHYHWKTDMLHPAIHHMGINMTPLDFSSRTITALLALLNDTERFIANPEDKHLLDTEMMHDNEVLNSALSTRQGVVRGSIIRNTPANTNGNGLTTANVRGNISIPNADGIVDVNGNGNGIGVNVGAIRKKSLHL